MRSICLLGCPDVSPTQTDDSLLMEALESKGAKVSVANWQDADPSQDTLYVIRSTWDYTEEPSQFLAKINQLQQAASLMNPFSLVEWNHDKGYLFELHEKQLPVVASYFPRLSKIGLEEWMLRHPSSEYLIKPRVGASGKKILRLEAEDLLELSLEDFVFVQPLLEEIFSEGEISQMFCQGEMTHAVVKTPQSGGEFRIQEEWGGTTKIYQPPQLELQFAKDILKSLTSMPLYARVDYVLVDSKPLLMELELIEPSLYFKYAPDAAKLYAKAILDIKN